MTTALQRVVVRMLFDEGFRARVHADPAAALSGLGIEERAHAWLRRPDPRAWRTDPHRRARALTALLEEFPAAAALAAAGPGGTGALHRFFGATHFHDCVQRGASLADAFASWLAADSPDARVVELARLEGAVAKLARTRHTPSPPGRLALGPGRALARTRIGTLSLLQSARAALGADPITAIVESRPLPTLPAIGDEVEWLLLVQDDGVRIEILPDALAELLEWTAHHPRTRDELLARAGTQGATQSESEEILNDLLADGTLA